MKTMKLKQGQKVPPIPPPKPRTNEVDVYCRIRPLDSPGEETCVGIISSTDIRLISPESSLTTYNGNARGQPHHFKYVFDDKISQKALFDHVALPLVTDLLDGKNGLLFTYGVTGSGKTFTMTGVPRDGGIMPRCLDVVFNSIGEIQAKKYVFKPDGMNGFEIQGDADAALDRHRDILPMQPQRTPAKASKIKREELTDRIPDQTKIENVVEDNNYAVFISYIEIYNNYVYDLLDEVTNDSINPKPPQKKILREDSAHNMYVHGCVEVEVKSTEDAFDVFYKGQKRKRMARTTLNTESSRSHSVFTIRLVQAPLDHLGEELLQNKETICISQLSLVDLAGSERVGRTKNTGSRLREAGNINTSLMALRNCIEILRKNQKTGVNELVPYRDSRLTHLFKNYFDGEGKVRMIICINPRVDDYDETMHVMRFAEITQEVQVQQSQGIRLDLGLTPGRRKQNLRIKEMMEKLSKAASNGEGLAPVQPMLYQMGPPYPSIDLQFPSDDITLRQLMQCLLEREICRKNMNNEYCLKFNAVRKEIIEMDQENYLLKQETANLKQEIADKITKLQAAERRLQATESMMQSLHRQLANCKDAKKTLENELDEKKFAITQGEKEKEMIKSRMHGRLLSEKGRIERDMAKKMKRSQALLHSEMRVKDEKLRALKTIITQDEWVSGTPTSSTRNISSTTKPFSTQNGSQSTLQSSVSDPKLNREPPITSSNFPVSNIRHRRSRSGGEVWIDHRPNGCLALDTIMQPVMKKRKSMSKLDPDVVIKEADRYCLTHQEQVQGGEVETKLIKGNVIPSVSGGAQVVFNEMEVLLQTSPAKKKLPSSTPTISTAFSNGVDVASRVSASQWSHVNCYY